ncbi:hypothetical protein Tco_1149302 [Tanacetum coccineum]
MRPLAAAGLVAGSWLTLVGGRQPSSAAGALSLPRGPAAKVHGLRLDTSFDFNLSVRYVILEHYVGSSTSIISFRHLVSFAICETCDIETDMLSAFLDLIFEKCNDASFSKFFIFKHFVASIRTSVIKVAEVLKPVTGAFRVSLHCGSGMSMWL